MATLGLVVAGSLLMIRLGHTSVLPASEAGWQKILNPRGTAESPVEDVASLPEFQTNWPRFRGWDGSGVAAGDLKTMPGILWRSAIPAPGTVRRLFGLTAFSFPAARQNRREVFCYNASNGALLWRRAIENVPGSPPKIPESRRTLATPPHHGHGRAAGLCDFRQRRPGRD